MKPFLLAALLSVLSPAMGTAQPSTSFVIDYQNPRVVSNVLTSDRVTVSFAVSTAKTTRLAVGKSLSVVVSGEAGDEVSVTDGTTVNHYTLTADSETHTVASGGKNLLTVGCVHAHVLTVFP